LQPNWILEFQKIQAIPESIEKYRALAKLSQDFTYAAQLYAKLIISEVLFVILLVSDLLTCSLNLKTMQKLFYLITHWVALLVVQSITLFSR
jgi:hypothetical protein